MINKKLRVPFALDDEKWLCDPETADRGRSYYCPACKDSVILKRGDFKIPHFAHKDADACNQETILHKTAKQLIVEVISEWKSGKIDAPILRQTCNMCDNSRDISLSNISQLDEVDCAIPEYRTSHGFLVDVALIDANTKPVAAIKIKGTQAIGKNKAKKLSLPFIELEGEEIIDNPYLFEPIRGSFEPFIEPFTCTTCKTIISGTYLDKKGTKQKFEIYEYKSTSTVNYCVELSGSDAKYTHIREKLLSLDACFNFILNECLNGTHMYIDSQLPPTLLYRMSPALVGLLAQSPCYDKFI